MTTFASKQDILDLASAEPWEAVRPATTLYGLLTKTRDAHGDRPALSYQLFSDPKAPAEAEIRQAYAEALRAAGRPEDSARELESVTSAA